MGISSNDPEKKDPVPAQREVERLRELLAGPSEGRKPGRVARLARRLAEAMDLVKVQEAERDRAARPRRTPYRNPARDVRRSYGPMSGRQWVRLRRELKRAARLLERVPGAAMELGGEVVEPSKGA